MSTRPSWRTCAPYFFTISCAIFASFLLGATPLTVNLAFAPAASMASYMWMSFGTTMSDTGSVMAQLLRTKEPEAR